MAYFLAFSNEPSEISSSSPLFMIRQQILHIVDDGDQITSEHGQDHEGSSDDHDQGHPGAGRGTYQPAKGAGEPGLRKHGGFHDVIRKQSAQDGGEGIREPGRQ